MEERKKISFWEQLMVILGCSLICFYLFFRFGFIAFSSGIFCRYYEINFFILIIVWYAISLIASLLLFLYVKFIEKEGKNEK
jgi:membrane protein implicated in regulation of membrane protease activity